MATVFFILYHRILRLFVNILILSADILITLIRFKKHSFMSFLNRTRILSALS